MDINNVLGYVIAAAGSVICAWITVRRKAQETEARNEILHETLKTEIQYLKVRIDKMEKNDERLMNIEKRLIKIDKDIEYIKKG